MSWDNIDYAISGFSLAGFEAEALRLFGLADRLVVVALHVWGNDGGYQRALFREGTDLRDARGVLQIDPALASRMLCVVRVPLEEGHTNLTLTVARRDGWTLVEGQLYAAEIMRGRAPRNGVDHMVRELVRIANDLHLSMLNVVDEDASPLISDTEIQRPLLLSIFDPELLPSLVSSTTEFEGKRLLCLVELATFPEGGAPTITHRALLRCMRREGLGATPGVPLRRRAGCLMSARAPAAPGPSRATPRRTNTTSSGSELGDAPMRSGEPT